MTIRMESVTAPGGLRLAVFEAGPLDAPPVLLVHGISQSHLAFERQLTGRLADRYRVVAFDLRGHGASDKPDGGYDSDRTWADDIAAVIAERGLIRPIVVGWSFGMVAALDYVRHHGDATLAGLILLAGPLRITAETAADTIGPAFRDAVPGMLSDDVGEAVRAAASFVTAASGPLSQDALYRAIGYNLIVPAHVRRGMFAREFDHRDVAERLTVPTVYAIGEDDPIIPASLLDDALAAPSLSLRRLTEAGHSWFSEQPARFEALVDEVAAMTRAQRQGSA